MKVKELIVLLAKANPEAEVVVEKELDNGCSTCGWGATSSEVEINDATDLETRVVLNLGY